MSKKMSKVIDHTQGDLQKAIQFSRKIQDLSLIRQIQRKRTWSGWEKLEVHLYSDRAPHSMLFSIVDTERDESVCFGGIIYHGQHDNGGDGSSPTYSVCLNATYGWASHT